MILILDLETIVDPDLPGIATDDRLPAPMHHQVVAVGALLMDERYRFLRLGLIGEGKDEPGILGDLVAFLDARTPWIVTFNGRGFDLPVIAARCFRHGLTARHYYAGREVRHRYTDAGHFDLMDFLGDFGAGRSPKLDAAARACGMPGKVGIDGGAVGGLIAEGRLAEVQRYCLCDVAQTAGVLLRVQLLRGELKRDEYLEAARYLVDWIRWDPRLAPVAERLNAKRFLLEES